MGHCPAIMTVSLKCKVQKPIDDRLITAELSDVLYRLLRLLFVLKE